MFSMSTVFAEECPTWTASVEKSMRCRGATSVGRFAETAGQALSEGDGFVQRVARDAQLLVVATGHHFPASIESAASA